MYCYSTYLKIKGGSLYGRRHFWSKWIEIFPEDIQSVKEYGFFDSYIKIWTTKGDFFVGAFSRQYIGVTEFLKTNTSFDLTVKTTHKFNVFLFKKPLGRPMQK